MDELKTVSIELKPGVYNQFRNLNNKVWYAISEFVDNAVQSYLDNKDSLIASDPDYQFVVSITVDWELKRMMICDNAAGISYSKFQRAFEPANTPPNNSGLHEFGMGMKTASVWLANRWKVFTKALGEDVERTVEFDLNKVVSEGKETLEVTTKDKDKKNHYTVIKLDDLSKNAPSVMQMDKIKKHLASIYRKFIRTGELEIIVNGEKLSYTDPKILIAPYYKETEGMDVIWKKEISFKAGPYEATGFIGVLQTMSTGIDNGLSLFRRGRVILGSHDDKYRPKVICGQIGSPRYKRIFGELELKGFDVSFNKSSFQDDSDLEEFMVALKEEISSPEFDLYNQAEYYRQKSKEDSKKIAKQIISKLKKDTQPQDLTQKIEDSVRDINDSKALSENDDLLKKVETLDSLEESFEFNGNQYTLKVELINEPQINDLYSVIEMPDEIFKNCQVIYKINLAHPFFIRFDRFKKEGDYQPIVTIIKSLVLAELLAPMRGTSNAGNIRLLFNKYLQNL